MYTKIYNPNTNKLVDINSKNGIKLINYYISVLDGGASVDTNFSLDRVAEA